VKNIEITTTQNVTIQYGLASPVYRAIAFLLDLITILIGCVIIEYIQESLIPSAPQMMISSDFGIQYLTVFSFVLYSLVFEYVNNGQSLGKIVLKLRVIRLDGEKAQFLDYTMRWVFRWLDFYSSFGGVAVLGVISSTNNQRLGDLLANTTVVSVGKTERMRLQNLLKLNKMSNYTATYPQVTKMPEEAMLIVKETLQRQRKHNNFAHQQALDLLVKKMEQELDIEPPKNKIEFLKVLLKDYVVLTR